MPGTIGPILGLNDPVPAYWEWYLVEIASVIYNFCLSVAACTTVKADLPLRNTFHVAGMLQKQETITINRQMALDKLKCVTSLNLQVYMEQGFCATQHTKDMESANDRRDCDLLYFHQTCAQVYCWSRPGHIA